MLAEQYQCAICARSHHLFLTSPFTSSPPPPLVFTRASHLPPPPPPPLTSRLKWILIGREERDKGARTPGTLTGLFVGEAH